MQQIVKISREQVVVLTFLAVLGNIVYTHTWIDNTVDRSSWVAAFLGVLLIIPFALWILYLGQLFPQSDLLDILEGGLGKFLTRMVCIGFIGVNVATAVAQLNMFTGMINTFFLMLTPPAVIMFFLTVVSLLLANSGIIIFGWLTEILAVLGILNFFIAFGFAIPRFVHIEFVFPIFDTTWTGFLWGTFFVAGTVAEALLALMIIVRYIPDPGKHYLWVVQGIILGAIVIALAILVIIAMMSPELAKRVAFGGVNAARLIQIGTFIQGLEIFIFGSYQIIALGKIALSIYCSWICLQKIFSDKKALLQLLLIALFILIPAVWLSSYNRAYFLGVALGSYVLLPFTVLVLLLASISAFVQKKRFGSAPK